MSTTPAVSARVICINPCRSFGSGAVNSGVGLISKWSEKLTPLDLITDYEEEMVAV